MKAFLCTWFQLLVCFTETTSGTYFEDYFRRQQFPQSFQQHPVPGFQFHHQPQYQEEPQIFQTHFGPPPSGALPPPPTPPPQGGLFSLWKKTEWWQGPNVCMETDEIEQDEDIDQMQNPYLSYHTTSCEELESIRTCTTNLQLHGLKKTFRQTYRCCHGYRRSESFICEKFEIKPMLDTLRNVGGSAFADLISYARLEDELQLHNVTVLCPTDQALKAYRQDYQENAIVVTNDHGPQQVVGEKSTSSLVLSHIVSGFVTTGDFTNHQVLATNGMTSLYIQVYNVPDRVVTINCGRLQSVNNWATNGVVHVVDRVLEPPTKTAAQLMSEDRRFTIFNRLLHQTRMIDSLNDPEKHWTLIAPTDNAFHKLDRNHLHKLLRGEGCVEKFVQYHILPRAVCSTSLPQAALSRTLLGTDVRFRKDEDEHIFVNDIEIEQADMMATNGIAHVLDEKVLLTPETNSVTGVLDEFQLTDLISLLESSNMVDMLERDNVTFFAPTNKALKEATPYLRELERTPGKLQDMFRYHMVSPVTGICSIDNNQQISSTLPDKQLRFNQYHTPFFGMAPHVTVQCTKVLEMDRPACNSLVQVVEKVLFPPEGNLVDVLSSNQSFNIFMRILHTSGLLEELSSHGPYTVLAPTDSAFYRLPEHRLGEVLQNPQSAEQTVRRHLVPDMVCCAGIHEMTWAFHQTVRTVSGDVVQLQRHRNGQVQIGQGRVTACDIMADNGVVHAINRVIG